MPFTGFPVNGIFEEGLQNVENGYKCFYIKGLT